MSQNDSIRMTEHHNPFKQLRLNAGLTQEDLANLTGLQRLSVIKTEQYLLPSLPVGLKLWYEQQGLADPFGVYTRLRNFHINEFAERFPTRSSGIEKWMDYSNLLRGILIWIPQGESPTKRFRTELFKHYGLPTSAIKFCQFTGMHPATLSKIELGKTDADGAVALWAVFDRVLHVPAHFIDLLREQQDRYFLYKTRSRRDK